MTPEEKLDYIEDNLLQISELFNILYDALQFQYAECNYTGGGVALCKIINKKFDEITKII